MYNNFLAYVKSSFWQTTVILNEMECGEWGNEES